MTLNQEIQPDGHPSGAQIHPVDDPRVYLAAERTYLAWVRTSLGLMGFGFLIARFGFLIRSLEIMDPVHLHRSRVSPYLGFAIICFGVAVCVIAAYRHLAYNLSLRAGVANPPLGLRTTMTLAIVLAIAGLIMAVHILTF